MSARTYRRLFVHCSSGILSLACASLPASAAVLSVANCNDNGPGSLRDAVAAASSGDTIDLRSLTCNRIVLTSGAIGTSLPSLSVIGPGRAALTIDGNGTSRVVAHGGDGTLSIQGLSITNGYVIGEIPEGGCIRSSGSVELVRANVHHCRAEHVGDIMGFGGGAGVMAQGDVIVLRSAVYANDAIGSVHQGGGVLAWNQLVLFRSELYDNHAWWGGGAAAEDIEATYSQIHGNRADATGGGLYLHGDGTSGTGSVRLNKTTLSANRANLGGGMDARQLASVIVDSSLVDNVAELAAAASVAAGSRFYNSTIAYNRLESGQRCDTALDARGDVHLESTIVAGTTCTLGDANDLQGATGAQVVGSHNLVGRSGLSLPADTILATDPRLGPLADNGGPTLTRLPLVDSPVLDQGNNVLQRQFDQRGPGFLRTKGAAPDIGAVER